MITNIKAFYKVKDKKKEFRGMITNIKA